MNEEKFEFLGIKAWHDKGYFGRGITIASRESMSPHGKKVFDVIEQIVPEANIQIKQDYRNNLTCDIYTTSMFSPADSYPKYIPKGEEQYRKGIFLCCAVGNDSDESETFLSTLPCWTSIGACYLYNTGVKRTEYSSITDHLDFMSITNMKTKYGIFTGTSCATPVFASMLVLVQEFFKENCGRKLTNAELLDFIHDNTKDIGDERL